MKKLVKPYLASKILYDNRNQQEFEKDVFMDFALRIKIPKFKFLSTTPPEPDIIINTLKSKTLTEYNIGCEMKCLYWDKKKKGSGEKIRLENWRSFAKMLRKDLDHLKNGFEYLYGVISLRDFKILNKKQNQEKLSKEIIQLLKKERLPIYTEFENFPNQDFLIDNVESLRIETYAERDILWWETSLLSGETIYDIDILEKEILQKNSLDYNFDNCKEKWLLLFAEANNLGNAVSISSDELKNLKITENHKFDKVYYFDLFSESIHLIFPKYKLEFEVKDCYE